MANYLSFQQQGRILSAYLPHQVHVAVPGVGEAPTVTGVLENVDYIDARRPARLRLQLPGNGDGWLHPLATEVQPVLYDLADLPSLPPAEGQHLTPLVLLLRKLNFVSSLDKGTGEGVIAAEVFHHGNDVNLGGRTTLLHLLVHTGYIDPDSYEEGEGPDYEVFISSYGQVSWRNITADKLSVDQAGLTGRGTWHEVNGTWLLPAFEYLHELHVAVGTVAEPTGYYDADLHRHAYRYHYVRKQLPAGAVPYPTLPYMKGGPLDG